MSVLSALTRWALKHRQRVTTNLSHTNSQGNEQCQPNEEAQQQLDIQDDANDSLSSSASNSEPTDDEEANENSEDNAHSSEYDSDDWEQWEDEFGAGSPAPPPPSPDRAFRADTNLEGFADLRSRPEEQTPTQPAAARAQPTAPPARSLFSQQPIRPLAARRGQAVPRSLVFDPSRPLSSRLPTTPPQSLPPRGMGRGRSRAQAPPPNRAPGARHAEQ